MITLHLGSHQCKCLQSHLRIVWSVKNSLYSLQSLMLYKAFSFPMPLVHTSASVYEGFLVLVPVNQMVKQFLCVHPFCMDFLSELSQRVYLYPVVMLLLFFVSLMFPQTTRGVRNLQKLKLIMRARLPFPKILPDSAGQSQSLTPSGSLW